jgi:hypothetical protein
MSIRTFLWFSAVAFLSCEQAPEELAPIMPNLLPEVRYVSLVPDEYSAQPTMVANGKSTMRFTINQYDRDKKLLFKNIPFDTKILVNGKDILTNPFVFKTSEPGKYVFTLDGFPKSALLQESVTVTALADQQFEEFTIPIVFHYLVQTGITPDLPQIRKMLDLHVAHMNRSYRNDFGSKDPNSVDIQINFEAAKTDPEGQPLDIPGLDLINTQKIRFKDSDDDALHKLIWDGNFWSPKKYINVWISEFEENYSWARFPFLGSSSSEFPTNAFGVFFNVRHFNYERGISILIHEVGHMLNLYHNFSSVCGRDIDECPDTYDYQRDYSKDYKGGLIRNSCDLIEFPGVNYMDYYPTEYNTFTFEQRERMRKTVNLCPFLPTPRNRSARTVLTRSSLKMNWSVEPETIVF